jgi:hypothetical protein
MEWNEREETKGITESETVHSCDITTYFRHAICKVGVEAPRVDGGIS